MADLKISQLPAATVPLAGTEVLPIVQSGTTKQVSVDNVLTGRAILGANTFTAAQEWATGAAIASAATINLNTATGNRVHITGTTTITAVTLTRGPRTVIFDGVLTLTHNSTTNNLPGAANITTAAGDRAIYESDGTTVYCVSYIKVSGTAVVVSSVNLDQIIQVRQETSSGAGGGDSVSGDQVRVLNTVVGNTISGASLATNQITLPAGIYTISASAPVKVAGYHRARLVNVTDSAVLMLGSSASSGTSTLTVTHSFVEGKFTLTGTKALNITHSIQDAVVGGLGRESNDTYSNVYTSVFITKIG
jgi:hypothetical protein